MQQDSASCNKSVHLKNFSKGQKVNSQCLHRLKINKFDGKLKNAFAACTKRVHGFVWHSAKRKSGRVAGVESRQPEGKPEAWSCSRI